MIARRLCPRFATALWIGSMYAAIPFVRRVRAAFVARWPPEFIGYAVVMAVVGAAVVAVFLIQHHRRRIDHIDVMWLAGVVALVIVWIRRLMGQPEEAVHFLEYGVLGVLLYLSFADHIPDSTIFVVVTLVGTVVGTVDEIIQWLTPERFWDLRDIVLNGGAVALVQVAIWRLAPRPQSTVNAASVRFLCRLAAIQLLLLSLCLAATPQRLARLARYLPIPDRLANGTDVLCEYGHLHTIDDLNVFRSRLSPAELTRSDRQRAEEVARELDAARGAGGLVRSNISPVEDAFGYEIRIHLFARNRNLNKALEFVPGSDDRRLAMTTAWRENLILEHSFGSTLAKSSYRWGPSRIREVEAAQDREMFFVSRAATHLITRVSEGRLRAMMLAVIGFVVICDFAAARRFRRAAPPA